MRDCASENLLQKELEEAFILAWNQLVENRQEYLNKWRRMIEEGNPLKRLRAKQMIELTEQPPSRAMIPELGQLVLERIEVNREKEFRMQFMNGTEVEMRI